MKKLSIIEVRFILKRVKELATSQNFNEVLEQVAEDDYAIGYDWKKWDKNLWTFINKVSKGILGIQIPNFDSHVKFRIKGMLFKDGVFYAKHSYYEGYQVETPFEINDLILIGDDDRHYVLWVGYYHWGQYKELPYEYGEKMVTTILAEVKEKMQEIMWAALEKNINFMVCRNAHHEDYDLYEVWLDKGRFKQK